VPFHNDISVHLTVNGCKDLKRIDLLLLQDDSKVNGCTFSGSGIWKPTCDSVALTRTSPPKLLRAHISHEGYQVTKNALHNVGYMLYTLLCATKTPPTSMPDRRINYRTWCRNRASGTT
jgi:hypothetical protein